MEISWWGKMRVPFSLQVVENPGRGYYPEILRRLGSDCGACKVERVACMEGISKTIGTLHPFH